MCPSPDRVVAVQFDQRPTSSGSRFVLEVAIIFMRDSETKTLVEPPSGIDSDNIQADRKTELSGFANQSLHHFCADTPALKRAIHKHLRDKNLIIFSDGLQPADIGTVSAITRTCARFHCCPKLGFF